MDSSDPTRKSSGVAVFYATLLRPLRDKARELGYALGLHGSMVRDLDLIAAPWSDTAVSAEVLAEALRDVVGGQILPSYRLGDPTNRNPSKMPHGRMAWSIMLGGGAYIDLSVMPRSL